MHRRSARHPAEAGLSDRPILETRTAGPSPSLRADGVSARTFDTATAMLGMFSLAAVLAMLSLTYLRSPALGLALWPVNAVILAVVRHSAAPRSRSMFGAGLAGILAGMLATGAGWQMSVPAVACDGGEIAIAAWVIATVLRPKRDDVAAVASLVRYFIFTGGLAVGLSTLALAASLATRQLIDPAGAPIDWPLVEEWFASHSLGMMLVGPALLAKAPRDLLVSVQSPNRARVAILLSFAAGAITCVFGQTSFPLLFLAFPVLTLVAFAADFTVASAAVLQGMIIAIVLTDHGLGPLWLIHASPWVRTIVLQGYLYSIMITILPMAAARVARARVEAALIDQTARMRFYVENAADLTIALTEDGVLCYVSPVSVAMLGMAPELLDGTPLLDLVQAEDRTVVAQALASLRDHEQRQSVAIFRLTTPSEGTLWVEMTAAAVDRELNRTRAPIVCTLRNVTAQRQAAAALRDSEQRFRNAIEYSPIGMAVISLERRWLKVNNAFLDMLLYSADEFSALDPDAFKYADDQAAVLHENERLLAGDIHSYQMERRYRRKDGRVIWTLLAVSLVRDDDGRPQCFIAQISDIDARKRAEQAREEASRQLAETNRLLVLSEEIAHIGHWRLDALTQQVSWSDETFRIHGLSPARGAPPLDAAIDFYHPDDRKMVADHVRAAIDTKCPFAFEARVIRPSGEVREVACWSQCELAADGSVSGLFGLFQDITERKQARDEQNALRERLVLATKAGQVGIWEWRIDTREFIGDAGMRQLYGIPLDRDDLVLADWVGPLHPDDLERVGREVAAVETGQAAYDTEYRVVWPNGDIHHLRARGTLVVGTDGTPDRMIGTNWDVTEMRRLTELLEVERQRAYDANNAKSAFLASMSHEIRTPMNGVLGFTQLLLDGPLDRTQRRHAELLLDAGRSLLTIINDILDFSKIEAGKLELESIPFALATTIRSAIEIVRPQADAKGLTLAFDAAPDMPAWVLGDPTRLRQIALNLLTNAIKFTERGGVGLALTLDADGRVRVDVVDTGIGIPAERAKLLFNDFSQIDQSTTRRYGGTGLGLVICKRLSEAMGGTVGFESEVGRGSRFWFTATLPATAPVAVAATTPAPDEGGKARILVADDVPMNQIIIEAMLTAAGHAVALVANGEAAVSAARTGEFDLILMDMEMPVMDGIEATAAIRVLDDRVRDIPIVALTANALPEQVARCRAAGMNAHLAKPIDRDLLLRTVAAWIRDDAPATLQIAPSGAVILDETVLCDLENRLDESKIAAVVTILYEQLDMMAAALAEMQDAEILGREAHKMVSMAGSFGLAELMEECRRLMSAASSDGPAEVPERVAAVLAAMGRARRAVDVRYPRWEPIL